MSSIVISGDTSGSITLASPAVAGSNTVTMPAASGVCMVSGNMPAFSVYNSATQSITNNTFTKVVLDTKNFDTNNNFASNRFTPTVAGYYLFTVSGGLTGTASTTQLAIQLYKNGSASNPRLIDMNPSASFSTNSAINLSGSVILYMNGSTDYVETYVYPYGAGVTVGTGANGFLMTGTLVRAA